MDAQDELEEETGKVQKLTSSGTYTERLILLSSAQTQLCLISPALSHTTLGLCSPSPSKPISFPCDGRGYSPFHQLFAHVPISRNKFFPSTNPQVFI